MGHGWHNGEVAGPNSGGVRKRNPEVPQRSSEGYELPLRRSEVFRGIRMTILIIKIVFGGDRGVPGGLCNPPVDT